MKGSYRNATVILAAWPLLCALTSSIQAQAQDRDEPSMEVLTQDEWERVDSSVDRALAWIASQQQRDGSFPTHPLGQPGVTSLCVLAFLSQGHVPGEGQYGTQLQEALRFIASCQKQNGVIALAAANSPELNRNVPHMVGTTATYNHAISALALSESFATGDAETTKEIEPIITKALETTLQIQKWPKRREVDNGGWRYINLHDVGEELFDSDLSVTGWYLMSLRSAKNAGFEVPQTTIDDAVEYVRRCFDPSFGTFQIMATRYERRSRGMAGAGVLALAHAGLHNSPEAKKASDWLMTYSFTEYNGLEDFDTPGWIDDRYHYGVFQCCQGMYQMGGDYWAKFYPPTARTLLEHQNSEGAWEAESNSYDTQYGNVYTTALVVLALNAPNQLLPIFQR